MNVHKLHLGILRANCYIIETTNKNAVAIDIGGNFEKLSEFLSERELSLKKILLTHGHCDHIGGVYDAQSATDAEVYIHSNDAEMLRSSTKSLADYLNINNFKAVNKFTSIEEGNIISVDELSFEVIHTPGHTAGGVCYKCNDCLFTGDTLFNMSIGRTDFPGGNINTLLNSLKKITKLKDNYKIYPGHEAESTLSFEKNCNPYMKEYSNEDYI